MRRELLRTASAVVAGLVSRGEDWQWSSAFGMSEGQASRPVPPKWTVLSLDREDQPDRMSGSPSQPPILQLRGLPVILRGPFLVAHVLPRNRTVPVGVCIIRAQTNGVGELHYRVGETLQAQVHVTPPVVRRGALRIQFDGPVERP